MPLPHILPQAVKSESVSVSFERRALDKTEMTSNSILAMALNSHSSKCVQAVVDIITKKKVRRFSCDWQCWHGPELSQLQVCVQAVVDIITKLKVRLDCCSEWEGCVARELYCKSACRRW